MNVVKKVVVVTNSHSDIGEETALQFAALGCKMVLVGSDDAEIRQVALKCRQKSPRGFQPLEMRADLTVDAERVKLVDSVIDHYDRIDILVNNFDHGTFTPIDDANLIRNYDKILNADLRPLLHLIYLFRAHLEKSKGNIVNVSSVFGMRPMLNWTVYCMTKAALDMMTSCLALELGPKRIRVNSVNPGFVRTKSIEEMQLSDESARKFEAFLASKSALRRSANANDVAKAIVFLASDDTCSWATGTLLIVDGGMRFGQV